MCVLFFFGVASGSKPAPPKAAGEDAMMTYPPFLYDIPELEGRFALDIPGNIVINNGSSSGGGGDGNGNSRGGSDDDSSCINLFDKVFDDLESK